MKATNILITRKKTMNMVLMALMVLMAFNTAQAQEEPPRHPVVGIWTFDYPTTLRAAAGEGKIGYDTMEATDKQRVKSFYEGRRFAFNGNGTYRMQQGDGSIRDGRWAPSPDGGQITLSDGEQRFTYAISFTGGFLKMRLEGEQGGMALLRDWYLRSGR